jgi:hypothetical protein
MNWHKEILPELWEEIDDLLEYLEEWKQTPTYSSKQIRLENWDSSNSKILMLAIWEEVLLETQTIQAVVGACNHLVLGLDNILDRIQIVSSIIGLMESKTSIIQITQNTISGYLMVSTPYTVDTNIDIERHPLPLHRPQPIESNVSENGHIILGHPLKRHNEFICLDHLNRMNNIQIQINEQIASLELEPPSPRETDQSPAQWEIFKEKAKDHYSRFIDNGNKGFLFHKYDGRGRVYVTNYYMNYQGIDYQKALIETKPEKLL